MRVLLIADVHANWLTLLALQRAEAEPDAVLFAGDAVGYGPDPEACVIWLGAHARAAVRGNHDEAVLNGGPPAGLPAGLQPAAEESLAWTSRRLTPTNRETLAAWPLTAEAKLGGARFYVCHGTPANPLQGDLHPATAPEAELRALFEPVAADVIVLGHTHLPALRLLGRQLIVNPGSLGQPRYGVPDATYAVWNDGRVQIHHLHYDHGALAQRLRLARFGPDTLDVLSEVIETGLAPA